ncbi:MAG: DUF1102 domain-containing protein [Halobacteriota archaeon]
MQRRKFLAGMGSLAAASAAAVGTGAFNFANVEREADINVTNDANAFLALKATSGYADDSGGTLSINFNEDANAMGDGINQDSDYSFRKVFKIKNKGDQSVGVWINDDASSDSDSVTWYAAPDFSNSIEGPGNPYALDPGEEVYVNVVILNTGDNVDLPSTVNVVADASQGN